jgi:hypothetical protein
MTNEHDETTGDEEAYLFVVSYDDDAERKRAEYLFNNWDGGEIDAPDGFVRIASGIDHDQLYEKLVGKIPPEQVDSFRLEPVEADVSRDHLTVEQSINAPVDTVESFVEYILSKKKAVLQSASRNEYEVYTKKGRAEISYRLTDDDGTTNVAIQIEGYQPAPAFLADFFETELEDYAKSQQ